MIHYVYKITDPMTGQYYFGSRTCKCKVEDDINYMGSMKTWKPKDKSKLIKEILKTNFNTREDAIEFEDEIIGEHINDKLNENYHRPVKGFHTAGRNHTKETKQKIRENHADISGENNPFYGKTHTKETKQKMREANGGENNGMYGKKPWNTGKTHTEETKNKISETLKGEKHYNASKVKQLTKDGKFIKEWNYIKQAADELNIGCQNISACCRGRQKTSGGFKWKYN